ncbi:MAG: hypothetical protein M3R67_05785 [Acidobacteriota bacterium]|nr:hypothetical protein [Acidobacteriota bacterium]
MSKAIIADHFWSEMSEGQRVEAVLKGQATLQQMSEGLLYGSQELRSACQDSLAHTDLSFENLPVEPNGIDSTETVPAPKNKVLRRRRAAKPKTPTFGATIKHRFGLPKDFIPRLQRFGRTVLLERNLYRLPNGQEFLPCLPAGTLGTQRHLYALLTVEQYLKGKRGSVYVRTDGRVFDYSVDAALPLADIFDTGYTICDLERTGQYAPSPRRRRKKNPQARIRRAAVAG